VATSQPTETAFCNEPDVHRILVVDDEAIVRRLLKNFLERDGFEVFEAIDGEHALQVLTGKTPDVLIADVNMPRKSGIELLENMREDYPQIPVILITGMASVEAAVECMKIGAFDYISKPFEMAKLRDTVLGAIEQAKSGGVGVDDSTPGKLLGNYRIVRTLGEGNVGTVFLVERQTDGGKAQSALKILKLDGLSVQQRSSTLKRFLNEAEAVAKIEHPNVIRFIEYGVARREQIPYIVMEYFPSEPLQDVLPQMQELSFRDRVKVVYQVASGLAAIHEHGICHRDVKAGNIMVNPKTLRVKISDFGIAKLPKSELTDTSILMGSPAYMAPESFVSPDVDARADIFSLGVVAYELFLGTRPFPGENAQVLAYQIQNDRPPEPRKVSPDFPASLQVIVAKMLRKKPGQRYGTARELVHALETYLRTETTPGTAWRRMLDSLSSDWS